MEKTLVFHIGMITRGKGELTSAVDATAYIFGKQWSSFYDGNTYDHSDKAGEVVHTATLAPGELPAFVFQPYTFAHAVDWSEQKKNAQLFRHLYFSLPPEFTHEQQVALVHDFVQET